MSAIVPGPHTQIYKYSDSTTWVASAVFERLQHFKDVGVPGTDTSTIGTSPGFNQYAIADGSCRAVGLSGDGNVLLQYPSRIAAVYDAMKALPSSDGPSYMVLTAQNGAML